MSQRAARSRLQFCYALGSILLAIAVATALFSVFAYYPMFFASQRTLSTKELTQARYAIEGLSLMSIGTATVFLSVVGPQTTLWLILRHERPFRRLRQFASQEGRFDALRRCRGTLDQRRAQSHWESFCQCNRRFVIGCGIAILVGVSLAVVGYMLR